MSTSYASNGETKELLNGHLEPGPSSSRSQINLDDLKKKSLQLNGFGDGQSRRKAWLQLLDFEELEKKLPVYTNTPESIDHQNVTINNVDASIPIDNEGWQITSHLFEASYDEDRKFPLQRSVGNVEFNTGKRSEDSEWNVATSKRTRRRQRQVKSQESEKTSLDATPTTLSQNGTATTTPELISRETSLSGIPRIDSQKESEDEERRKRDEETFRESLKDERKARKRLKRKAGQNGPTGTNDSDTQDMNDYDLTSSIVHVQPETSSERDEKGKQHKDEGQVALDIRRSFIGLGNSPLRSIRREELESVIVGVLRRHPALNYYQGYHDVISVLLCVLVPHEHSQVEEEMEPANEDALEVVVDVACRLSLHFLRDAMTENMTPTLGHLKVLRDILRQNQNLAKKVEQAAQLPYFALSWLLSFFAHELEISLAELVFDYVFAREPASVLYLSAALIEQFQEKIDAPDAAEMHHVLSQLPTFINVNNLPGILEKADKLAESAPLLSLASDPKQAISQGVMGESSVLLTSSMWLASGKNDWQKADQNAISILQGDNKEIVINALPTPPASENGEDEFDGGNSEYHIKDDKALVSHSWWWHKNKAQSQTEKRKQILRRNNTAFLAFMGAFGAMSATALIFFYGGSVNSHSSFSFTSNTGGIGTAFPAGLRVAEPLRLLLRNALHH